MEFLSSVRLEKVFFIQDLAEQIHPIKQQSSYRKETSFFRKKELSFPPHLFAIKGLSRHQKKKQAKKKPQYRISILAKLGTQGYAPILTYALIFSLGFHRINSKQCGLKNLPAETTSALQLLTLLSWTTESLLITVENVLTVCLKVTCRTFGFVLPAHFPGYIQVETGSLPHALYR